MTDADNAKVIRVLITTPGELEGDREKIAAVIRGLEGWYGSRTRLESVPLANLALNKEDSVEKNVERILDPVSGIDIAVFIISSRSDRETPPSDDASVWTCREVLDLMLTAMSHSENRRPRVLAYLRENAGAKGKSSEGRPGQDLVANLIQKKKLSAHFVTERFRDYAGRSLRAYDSNREPIGLTGRLQVHLLGHLAGLAGPAPFIAPQVAGGKSVSPYVRPHSVPAAPAGLGRIVCGAAAIISLSLFLAYHSREERKTAEQNRQKVEELLVRAIAQVRPTLQAAGKESVLTGLTNQLDNYVSNLPQSERIGAIARQQAIQTAAETELAVNRGNLVEAQKLALKGLEAFQTLMEAEPENLSNKDTAAALELRLSSIYQAQREKDKAVQAIEAARKWRDQLVQAEPKNPHWITNLMDTELYYSRVLNQQGRPADAQKILEGEITTLKEHAKTAKDPFEWNSRICTANLDLAGLRVTRGDLSGSIKTLTDNLAVAMQLASKPSDTHYEERERQLLAIYRQLAENYTSQRNLDTAKTNADQALSVTRQMMEASPTSDAWKSDNAAVQLQLSGIYFDEGDLPGARASLKETLRIRGNLAGAHPESVIYQNDLAYAHLKMGEVLQAQSSADPAKAEFEESVTICRHLVDLMPGDVRHQNDLRASLYRLGKLQAMTGDKDRAQKTLESALEISSRLGERFPQDIGIQNELATAHLNLGGFLQRVKDINGARSQYQTALQLLQQLVDRNEKNALAQNAFVEGCQVMASFLGEQSDWPGAKQWLDAALKIRQRQIVAEPKSIPAQRNLATAKDQLGDALQSQGELKDAQECYESALKSRQSIANSQPSDLLAQGDVMVSRWKLGNLAIKRQNTEMAREQLSKGMDVLQKMGAHKEFSNKQKQWSLAFSEALQSLPDQAQK